MRVFEYCVLFTARQTKEQREAGETPETKLVVPITAVVAKDDKSVGMLAARQIPEEFADKLEQVSIAIRSF